MQTEEWLKIEELLNAALELEPSARRKFLDEVGERAPDMRREVESLLACEDDADKFLSAESVALSADFYDDVDDSDDRSGQIIGHYRVIREIGRGGMGAVYLAERSDGEFQQKVALKIVRGSFAYRELARRFRRERQILASLNHENIARLFDGGVSANGEPFLAMEYVEGTQIDNYCDAQNLSAGARLKLFLHVCHAVAYAHQHLVIHRDIKPSNILVTADGTPKLLDFGIAKLLDTEHAGELTQTDFRAFTPDYAAPEQVAGTEVTTATDVYSLGVLLDELLRGAHPNARKQFAPGAWLSADVSEKTTLKHPPINEQHKISTAEARNAKSVSPELRNIIAMARREEATRRYASVVQFAEDIQRYLDGKPISAQKDSLAYRGRKFIKRNKVGAATAALLLLTLTAGGVATVWQARRATAQARIAAGERDRAERRFADVRGLSNALLTDIAPKIERLQGATEAREALVTQSLKYLDSLAKEAGDDAELQSELATAYEKVGDIQGNPTNPSRLALKDALTSYEKANEMRRNLLAANPRDFEQRRLLANNHRTLGDIYWQTQEPTQSQKNTETALNLYAELLAEQPNSIELHLAAAQTNLDTGQNLSSNQKFDEAIHYIRRAIDAAEALRQSSPNRIDVLKLLANARREMGDALSWQSRQPEAEAEMQRAIAIYEPLVAANPNDVSVRAGMWQTYWMTSSIYEENNDRLANEYDFKALKIVQETVERDPANLRARQQLARTYSHLGVTFENLEKPAESVFYLEKAVAMFREMSQNETKNRRLKSQLATALIRLGDARHKQKEFNSAVEDLESAAALLENLIATDAEDNASLRILTNAHESLAKAHEALARTGNDAARQSHRQQARQRYNQAIEIYRTLEAKAALSNYDRKALEKLRAAVLRYEQ